MHVLAVTAGSGYASAFVDRLEGDEGFDVTAVPTVNDAVELLASTDDVECVVSDADTPEVDGVTFLQMVRVQHPDLPFFLFTSEADGSVAARAMSARVTDYFVGERLEQDQGRLADMIERAVDYYRLQCEDPDRGTRVRDVLDALPDMVCIAREDAVVHANARAVEVLGLEDAEALVGRPLAALFADDDAGGLAPLDAIAAGERAVDRSEAMMVDADGDPVPVDLTAARIVWGGEPAVLVVARDLTQRRVLEGRLDEALRVNEVLRRVDRAVINASDREELDAAICETLAAADPYVMAWIGERDDETGRVTPRASAGDGTAYLDDIEITTGDGRRSGGPTGRALETGEVTVVQQTTDDPSFEPWRDTALEHGFRSSAAVPLRHDGDSYGVLNVYADREIAFDDDEVALLDELGRDVGHALAGLDARSALEERVKEMEGVRAATQLLHRSPGDRPLAAVFDDFVDLVPPAFQHPERTAVRLSYGDIEATTEGYVDGGDGIDATGETAEGDLVELDVVYTDEADPAEVGPFLQEETDLLDTFVGLITDCLDRKAYVEEIERVKERFQAFVENAGDGIAIVDEYGVFQYVSPPMERILGRPAEEIEGRNAFTEFLHPDDAPWVVEEFAETVTGDEPERSTAVEEFRLRDGDGGWVWVETTLSDAETDQGYVTVTRDITERRERQAKMEWVEERYKTVHDNVHDGLFMVDVEDDGYRYVDFNERMLDIVGVAPEQARGATPSELFDEEIVSAVTERYRECVDARETTDFEVELDFPSGTKIIQTRLSPVVTDGEVTQIVGVVRDVTEEREREAEIERVKERFQAFVENASDIITVVDRQGEITYVSPSVEDVLGYTPEERLGVSAFEDIHPDDVDEVMERFAESVGESADEAAAQVEYRVRDADGDWVWVETSGNNVETGEGYVTVTRDISARKRSERELRETSNVLERILDITPASIFVKNRDGEYVLMNDECREVMDVDEDDLGDVTDHDLLPEETAREFREDDRRVIEAGVTEEIEEQIQTDDGVRTLLTLKSPIEYEEGEPPGVCGVAVDITDLKERERELERSEQRLSMALDTADAGVWEWSVGSEGVFWSTSMERLFGLEPGGFEGTYEAFAERIHPDDRDDVMDGLRGAMERDGRFDYEFRIVRDDGGERWIQASAEVATGEENHPDRIIGVAVDVTERKEREIQLRVTDRVLRHNLRNDVNVIRGYAESIAEATTEPVRPFARKILETSDDLMAMADKERDVVEVLTEQTSVAEVDVAAIVRRAVEHQRAAHPEATIALDAPDDAVVTVAERFEEAVEELVENAIGHSDRASPAVEVALREDDGGVALTVADDGPGIPRHDVRALSTGDETPLEHGSGVGLWLVHWIVRRSNGTLSFEDNEPRGTVARITIPSTRSRSHEEIDT